AEDTLQDVVDKINDSGAPLTASVFSDSAGAKPHRISILSSQSGVKGRLAIDASGFDGEFDTIVAPQDARLLLGSVSGGGILTTSSTNSFTSAVPGVSLTIKGTSEEAVSVTVSSTDASLVSGVQSLVDQYNKLRDKLDEYASFDQESNSVGVLFGSNEVLRIESGLTQIFTSRFFGVGDVQSLEQVGVSIDDTGKLSLDKAKLQAAFAADPDAVEQFFTDDERGFSARLDTMAESLVGPQTSLLISRVAALNNKIDQNDQRVARLNERLDKQRELLLSQFYAMESIIAKLQDSLSVVQSLQALPPLTVSSN
ncbi:MAG: flagellar filament capping protein FliD, partial [Planctomycetales bacterium]|nr:flagellar filament capping protein FliD [Planctomycetales bacterium]